MRSRDPVCLPTGHTVDGGRVDRRQTLRGVGVGFEARCAVLRSRHGAWLTMTVTRAPQQAAAKRFRRSPVATVVIQFINCPLRPFQATRRIAGMSDSTSTDESTTETPSPKGTSPRFGRCVVLDPLDRVGGPGHLLLAAAAAAGWALFKPATTESAAGPSSPTDSSAPESDNPKPQSARHSGP